MALYVLWEIFAVPLEEQHGFRHAAKEPEPGVSVGGASHCSRTAALIWPSAQKNRKRENPFLHMPGRAACSIKRDPIAITKNDIEILLL